MRSPTSDEPPTNFASSIKVTPSKRTGTIDGVTRSSVCWGLSLEQGQDSRGTIRRPGSDEAPIGFTQ
ncbi:hypothetical protein ABIB56_003728 [Glaciihabitans sp. UYNi722]